MWGSFFNDLMEPHICADVPAVTLATTLKAMYPAANHPQYGSGFFNRQNRKMALRAYGRFTTVLTPGNLVVSVLFGTGADANGVTLQSSAAVALQASQTNLSWECDFKIHTRTTGVTGTLFVTGRFWCNNALILSTAQPLMIPASAPAASGSCDLTGPGIISLQFSRSGSTAETAQIHDMEIRALN